jgi:hypothetical protein
VITGELKSKVDRIWDTMWSGGISNPLSVIEPRERMAGRTERPIEDPTIWVGPGSSALVAIQGGQSGEDVRHGEGRGFVAKMNFVSN